MTDIAALTATELLRHYRAKKLSPVEITRAVYARIDKLNPTYNAFTVLKPDEALAQARESEARWMKGAPAGPVDGVPTTIKDQWLVKGWTARSGSRTTSSEPSSEDTPSVARLRESGAVLIGKTTMPEFGWKGVGDSPLSGISRNPWNPAKTCGGSSAGAGIAAALNLGFLHQGSDGAGSIRMPATFCGVFGMKSTFGRVPAWPHGGLPMSSHTGPLVRSVADAALMLNVITKPDHRDWLAPPYDGRDYLVGLENGVRGLRVCFSPNFGYVKVDAEIAELVRRAAKLFEALGAHVEERDPGFSDPREPMELFYRANMANVVAKTPKERRGEMDPGYLRLAAKGENITGYQLTNAWLARDAFGRFMNEFHTRYDLLLSPSLPLAAFDVGQDYPPDRGMTEWFDWSPFHYPFNFSQQPAACVPCGLTPAGLPAGLQIVGPRYAEALVMQAARAYEAASPFMMPKA